MPRSRPPSYRSPFCTLVGALCFLATACGGAPDGEGAAAADATPEAEAGRSDGAASPPEERVAYAVVDGDTVYGHLVRPADDDGEVSAVLLIHEWWGLNEDIREKARALAEEGFAALAVDLFGGQVAESPEQARELTSAVEEEAAVSNLGQALDFLEREVGAARVGALGWCFGGGWSLRAALAMPDRLDAAVIYYGRVPTEPERLAILEAPVLGIFGGEDSGIPVEGVRRFEAVLDSLDHPAEVHVYEGADHAFANPQGERYHPEAAADAWSRTVDFLRTHLEG